jgi:hypothetical protein
MSAGLTSPHATGEEKERKKERDRETFTVKI